MNARVSVGLTRRGVSLLAGTVETGRCWVYLGDSGHAVLSSACCAVQAVEVLSGGFQWLQDASLDAEVAAPLVRLVAFIAMKRRLRPPSAAAPSGRKGKQAAGGEGPADIAWLDSVHERCQGHIIEFLECLAEPPTGAVLCCLLWRLVASIHPLEASSYMLRCAAHTEHACQSYRRRPVGAPHSRTHLQLRLHRGREGRSRCAPQMHVTYGHLRFCRGAGWLPGPIGIPASVCTWSYLQEQHRRAAATQPRRCVQAGQRAARRR